jgi:mRNA-degrading endonuclease RelE of RelBE toxin-antitoxin system
MKIRFTDYFQKQVKKLSKDFPNVGKDLLRELENFSPNFAIDLGKNIFKLRVKNSDIPCGKSGGYRLIVYFSEKQKTIVPFIIFSKRDRENVSVVLIERALEKVLQ